MDPYSEENESHKTFAQTPDIDLLSDSPSDFQRSTYTLVWTRIKYTPHLTMEI